MGTILTCTQFASLLLFLVSLMVNIFFIYIVYSKTRQETGSYKYVLMLFSFCNIAFSTSEFALKPTIFLHGYTYMAYSNSHIGNYRPWGFLCLCFFIGMYGMNTAILTLQFIYRYLAVCRHDLVHLLNEARYKLMWIAGLLLWSLSYMFITFHCFAVTDEFVSYVRTAVLNRLQRNIDNMSLICVFPFEKVNEKTIIHWKSAVGVAVMVSMMLLSLFLMLFYGVKTVQTLRKVAMSVKTRTLQTQLMKALVFQATVPFFLSYLPRFSLFAVVIFGYSDKTWSMFVPFLVTLMSVIDPIGIMYFIHDYRRAVSSLFRQLFRANLTRVTIISPTLK